MPTASVSPAEATGIAFAPHELAHMQRVIDAVCVELGVTLTDKVRRQAIAQRVIIAYQRGSRLPLNMVSAGLAEQPDTPHA